MRFGIDLTCRVRAGIVPIILAVAATPMTAQRIEPVGPAVYKKPAKERSRAEARVLPPSVQASLPQPVEAALPPLSDAEWARARSARAGPRVIGIHRAIENELVKVAREGSQFGIRVPGAWSKLADGRRVWRLAVRSPGAASIRLHFRNFDVRDGLVWIHDGRDGGGQIEGPYTGKGSFGDGDFWSPTIFSDAAVIEYLPADGDSGSLVVPFRVVKLSHGWGETLNPQAAPFAPNRPREGAALWEQESNPPLPRGGSSKSASSGLTSTVEQAAPCHLDVTCFPRWDSTAVAAARFTVEDDEGFSFRCSGTLLNTRNSSFIPYFLTASHCVVSESEARSVETF